MTAEALRERQRRAARRNAIVLSVIAAAFYLGFILLSVHRSGG